MATQADFDKLGNWAQMLNPDANIDRRTCSRVVPLEVLCLGLPRTGSLSMWEAMEILGYPTYHYSSIFGNVRDADMWIEALNAKRHKTNKQFKKDDFDQLLGHVSAITDVPAVCFWKELLDFYPNAKVVLVQRDEDRWMKSMSALLGGVLNPIGKYVIRFTDPWFHGRIIGCGMAWIRLLHGTDDLATAEGNAREVYRKHYRDIRAALKSQPERLLEHKLADGWKPLCDFLEKPVPNVEFPNKNDAECFERVLSTFLGKALMNSLKNLAVVFGGVAIIGGILWQVG